MYLRLDIRLGLRHPQFFPEYENANHPASGLLGSSCLLFAFDFVHQVPDLKVAGLFIEDSKTLTKEANVRRNLSDLLVKHTRASYLRLLGVHSSKEWSREHHHQQVDLYLVYRNSNCTSVPNGFRDADDES